MTRNEEAKAWLDRIMWRLLADDAHVPRGAHLNQVNWHERQLIAGIRRGIRTVTPQEDHLWTGNIESEYPTEGENATGK